MQDTLSTESIFKGEEAMPSEVRGKTYCASCDSTARGKEGTQSEVMRGMTYCLPSEMNTYLKTGFYCCEQRL